MSPGVELFDVRNSCFYASQVESAVAVERQAGGGKAAARYYSFEDDRSDEGVRRGVVEAVDLSTKTSVALLEQPLVAFAVDRDAAAFFDVERFACFGDLADVIPVGFELVDHFVAAVEDVDVFIRRVGRFAGAAGEASKRTGVVDGDAGDLDFGVVGEAGWSFVPRPARDAVDFDAVELVFKRAVGAKGLNPVVSLVEDVGDSGRFIDRDRRRFFQFFGAADEFGAGLADWFGPEFVTPCAQGD